MDATVKSQNIGFWKCVFSPESTFQVIADEGFDFSSLWRLWVGLIAFAVVGSLIYGASLGLTLWPWSLSSGALWITVSAGLGWVVFIPVMTWVARRRLLLVFHACLVSMACGELVLLTGAVLNALLFLTGFSWHGFGYVFNPMVVLCSNILMGSMLAAQLERVGVSVFKTVAAWIFVLDGFGAAFFYLFYRLWGV